MFSGIIETTSRVLSAQALSGSIQIQIERPSAFTDLSVGDSIAVDGVCLTIEAFDPRHIQFNLGPETIRITDWTLSRVTGKVVNLERSLRLNDRLHGHMVTGHVDTISEIMQLERHPESLTLRVKLTPEWRPLIWPKGSVGLNGVSLTVNQTRSDDFTVGLIPETLRRTNLISLGVGSVVNLEFDNLARGLVQWLRLQQELR